MKSISKFYTIFWIIYFPCCIAFTLIVKYDFLDELMAIALVVFAVGNSKLLDKSKYRNNEIWRFIFLALFYLAYSFVVQITTPRGIWLDFLQQLRPYMVFYTTWVMAPQFDQKQRKWIKYVLLGSLVLYLALMFIEPELVIPYMKKGSTALENEFAVIGQLSICVAMIYYLFSKKSKYNRLIAIVIMLVGLLGGKSKFIGECVVFISLMIYVKGKIKLSSPKTILAFASVVVMVVFFTWTKFNAYFVTGMQGHNAEIQARPASYKTARKIIFEDYVPFGSGLGTFGTAAAAKEYSPLYEKYHLNRIWGMSREFPWFIADAFYPSLAEFGMFGLIFFFLFWKRRVKEIQKIPNLGCYRMAWMCFMALMLENVADTSYLSGKGMGYFMILAVCLNSAKIPFEEEKVNISKYGVLESLGNEFRKSKVIK